MSSTPCVKASVEAALTHPIIAWHFVQAACTFDTEPQTNLCESCLWAVGRRGGEDIAVVVSQSLPSCF